MNLLGDIRLSVRTLLKSPGFTAVAVMMLALGIGVNATVFTVTNAVLFKGFPLVAGNDRLAYISNGGCCVSYPDFEDYRAQAKSFDGMAMVHGVGLVLSDAGGFPENIDGNENSADVFKLVGARPILGRDFTTADETPGAPAVAILNYGFWERRYGKDPAVIGRMVRMNGAPTTIIGVMPQGFSFPQKVEVWVPLVKTPEVVQKRENRDTWFAFGRLAEGATFERARAEIETIGKQLANAYPLYQSRLPPGGGAFPRVLHRPQRDYDLRVHVGRGWFCALDRVRQSGESPACPRDWQVARDFRPHRARRGALEDHPATPHREPDALGPGRLAGLVDCQMGCSRLPARHGLQVVVADPGLRLWTTASSAI